MLTTEIAKHSDLSEPWYAHWTDRLGIPSDHLKEGTTYSVRKAWEWAAITQVLHERYMLEPGRRGLGYAVGQEGLPALFAARGAEVVATDLPVDDMSAASPAQWAASSEHAQSRDPLFKPWMLSREEFDRRVSFQPTNMLYPTRGLEPESFDFIWSSCSLEHLGTLQLGLDFVRKSATLLKSGGVAVHTTEFNVSSNDATIESGGNVFYRRRDIEGLDGSLRMQGCGLEPPDWRSGTHRHDLVSDADPYFGGRTMHLKLSMAGFVVTSMMIIVRRG